MSSFIYRVLAHLNEVIELIKQLFGGAVNFGISLGSMIERVKCIYIQWEFGPNASYLTHGFIESLVLVYRGFEDRNVRRHGGQFTTGAPFGHVFAVLFSLLVEQDRQPEDARPLVQDGRVLLPGVVEAVSH